MAILGKRLTCPLCRDSSFFSLEQLASVNGIIYCDNHPNWVEMVDLAVLMEIMGLQVVVVEAEDFEEVEGVDFDSQDMNTLHPDDFEFGGTYGTATVQRRAS